MSSAQSLTVIICLAVFTFTYGMEGKCPGKHSVWDKWYDGCNWCVCTEYGPICTNKSCYRIPVDQCDLQEEKWRDGCYKCECTENGIVCEADNRCLHAMSMRKPFPSTNKLGCVCGLDGVPSCVADTAYLEMMFQAWRKGTGKKHTPNESHVSKSAGGKITCFQSKRWYSGTRRCFCADENSEPECGTPRHIAHRIDSYRFKPYRCEKEARWTYYCRSCVCNVDGFAFCVRIPGCKRDLASITSRKRYTKLECDVGTRWREGCKQCHCNSHKRVICESADCNISGHMAETKVVVIAPKTKLSEETVRITGHKNKKNNDEVRILPDAIGETKISQQSAPKFQIPPLIPSVHMVRTFRKPKTVEDALTEILCKGKHKPGEKFYDGCNLCQCLHGGESKCTAILCV